VQSDLFGESGATAPQLDVTQALIRIEAPAAKLSKGQREFNRLTELIGRLRNELALWRAARERAGSRQAAEVGPLQSELRTTQREIVLWVDAFLARPQRAAERLPKKLRRKLGWMLQHLAQGVLISGADEEIEALLARHAPQGDGDDPGVDDWLGEELFAEATPGQEDADPGAQAHAERAPHRTRGAGKAQARETQLQKEASQSVRDVYRRLASSLHPDREPDAAERARKTVLMAKVNEAYERSDLLGLLALQMAIEQIDGQHLRDLPEQRLRQYIRVLKDQEYTLRAGIESEREPLRTFLIESGAYAPKVVLSGYERMVDDQVLAVRAMHRQLKADFALLRDERSRRAFLTALEITDPDDEDSQDDEVMEAIFAEFMAKATRPAGGRKRR
jgi:hypothetical protein